MLVRVLWARLFHFYFLARVSFYQFSCCLWFSCLLFILYMLVCVCCCCLCMCLWFRQTFLNPWSDSIFRLSPLLLLVLLLDPGSSVFRNSMFCRTVRSHSHSSVCLILVYLNKICVSDVSSFVCHRIGWQADDQGSLLIIAVVPPYHRPGSAIKTCVHTLENEFSRAPLISSIARMSCHTWHTETAVHLKAHKWQAKARFSVLES